MTRIRLVYVALAAIAFTQAAHAAGAAASCGRACLLDMITTYTDALVKHDAKLLPVSATVRVTENGHAIALGDGLFKTAQSFSYKQSFVDVEAGQAGFYGVVQEPETGSAIFALRLKEESGQISEIETLVARKGSHAIFTPEAMLTPKAVWNDVLPEDERSSRTTLIDAANAYFDGIEKHSAASIPFHPDCIRTENGTQTTSNPPRFALNCGDSIPAVSYIKRVRDRRFPVVDEQRGLVWAIVLFDIPGDSAPVTATSDPTIQTQLQKTRSLLLFELFKVESGRIREIEAFMANQPLGAPSGWNP